jgi:hypothetical protein
MASAEAWAVQEAAEAGVRDERQRRTLAGVLTALLAGRGASWSVALGAGLRQAGGDLVGRSRLGLANLLAGHVAATVKRCTRHARVVLG